MASSSDLETLRQHVRGKIERIQRPYLATRQGAAVSTLARLRRAVAQPPGADPSLWGVILEDLPDNGTRHGETPSQREWAAHLAITLYAVHQQSKVLPMHAVGTSLGKALGRLDRAQPKSDDGVSALKRRFDALVTATGREEMQHHIRGLVQLLRQSDASIDYGGLAADLVQLLNPKSADLVRLRWGRDFVSWGRARGENNESENSTDSEGN